MMTRRKKTGEREKDNSERWLLTYSDMMNNLLILFMVLYAMSVIDLAKFQAMATGFSEVFSSGTATESQNNDGGASEYKVEESATAGGTDTVDQQFDKVYETIQEKLAENGYEDMVKIERGADYIKISFGENVLFYPDSANIKTEDIGLLKCIGDTMLTIEPYIQSIEISGHTATTGQQSAGFFSWELSADRSISVLKYLIQTCHLPESKMTISGYSRYRPVASNENEESRQLNRRVEIKITRIASDTDKQSASEQSEPESN